MSETPKDPAAAAASADAADDFEGPIDVVFRPDEDDADLRQCFFGADSASSRRTPEQKRNHNSMMASVEQLFEHGKVNMVTASGKKFHQPGSANEKLGLGAVPKAAKDKAEKEGELAALLAQAGAEDGGLDMSDPKLKEQLALAGGALEKKLKRMKRRREEALAAAEIHRDDTRARHVSESDESEEEDSETARERKKRKKEAEIAATAAQSKALTPLQQMLAKKQQAGGKKNKRKKKQSR